MSDKYEKIEKALRKAIEDLTDASTRLRLAEQEVERARLVYEEANERHTEAAEAMMEFLRE